VSSTKRSVLQARELRRHPSWLQTSLTKASVSRCIMQNCERSKQCKAMQPRQPIAAQSRPDTRGASPQRSRGRRSVSAMRCSRGPAPSVSYRNLCDLRNGAPNSNACVVVPDRFHVPVCCASSLSLGALTCTPSSSAVSSVTHSALPAHAQRTSMSAPVVQSPHTQPCCAQLLAGAGLGGLGHRPVGHLRAAAQVPQQQQQHR